MVKRNFLDDAQNLTSAPSCHPHILTENNVIIIQPGSHKKIKNLRLGQIIEVLPT